jgi:alkanesulfonate monooxygenase SsuD/methylene tetrahydromethanopterin reductase-like flavin-dependent oxidoreductase (luciferase family)
VWLAGGGSVETYEMAVNNDYTYNFLSFFGYQFAKKVMDTFWDTADRLGADRNPYRAGFAQQICVAETDEQARSCTPSTSCTSSRSASTCRRTSWRPPGTAPSAAPSSP